MENNVGLNEPAVTQSSDLEQRLRDACNAYLLPPHTCETLREAADELSRLRAESDLKNTYTAKLLAALAESRNATIEECAKMCESRAPQHGNNYGKKMHPNGSMKMPVLDALMESGEGYRKGHWMDCANAIRALATPKDHAKE